MLWAIFRNYFLGTIVPVCVYILFKQWAHDTKNYYHAELVGSPNSPIYDNNINYASISEKTRQTMLATNHKDFLGRSKLNIK
jgi:hypothetical protein